MKDYIEKPYRSEHHELTPAGLDQDVANAFHIISYRIHYLEESEIGEIKLEPLQTFEEYMESKLRAGYTPKEIEEYKRRSTPQAIATYNTLVREFNAAIPAIQNDIATLKEYLSKFRRLTHGNRS